MAEIEDNGYFVLNQMANMTMIQEVGNLSLTFLRVLFSTHMPKTMKRNMTSQEFHCDLLDLVTRFPKDITHDFDVVWGGLCGGQRGH